MTAEVKAAADAAKADIIAGKIQVHDYIDRQQVPGRVARLGA